MPRPPTLVRRCPACRAPFDRDAWLALPLAGTARFAVPAFDAPPRPSPPAQGHVEERVCTCGAPLFVDVAGLDWDARVPADDGPAVWRALLPDAA